MLSKDKADGGRPLTPEDPRVNIGSGRISGKLRNARSENFYFLDIPTAVIVTYTLRQLYGLDDT